MAAEAASLAAEQQLNGSFEQHNGEFNPDAVVDDDDQKKLRPPDIDADVRDMERRRRVEVMMGSRTFRDDLERIVDQQLREGGAAGLFALQQHISDLTGMGKIWIWIWIQSKINHSIVFFISIRHLKLSQQVPIEGWAAVVERVALSLSTILRE